VSIELVPLCNATVELRDPLFIPNGPAGTRMIVEVASATLEGDRMRGKLKGVAAADWLAMAPDGVGTLDVRALWETDDGALIFMAYKGRTDVSKPGVAPLYIAPLFETGDDRYRWLNLVQAVGKGKLDGQTLTYEVFEIR
jgi:hypothetical protein